MPRERAIYLLVLWGLMYFLLFCIHAFAADSNTVSTIQNGLAAYTENYFKGLSLLAEFDTQLDRGDDLSTSLPYAKLQSLHQEQHQIQDRILVAYRELAKSQENLHALRNVHNILATQNDLDAVAASDLRESLQNSMPDLFSFLPAIHSFDGIDTKRILSESRKAIDLRVKKHIAFSSYLPSSDFFPAMVQALGLPYAPGIGASGNITGSKFPANTWALTYDDGPSPKYTPMVLANLATANEKTTFFWLAENVEMFAPTVRAAKAAGMALNNHSYTHMNLVKASPEDLQHEIVDAVELETKAYGEKPRFFRCPYGSGVNTESIRQLIADQGMIHVLWNVDSLDWSDKDPDSVLARTKKQMRSAKGGVILFHDIHPQSVAASKLLLDYAATLKGTDEQIRFVTLPQIVDETPN